MPVINRLPTGDSGSSGSSSINVFTQMTEPETKEGIWLQTSTQYESVKIDDGVYLKNKWITNATDLPPLITTNLKDAIVIPVGIYIYIFKYCYLYRYSTIDFTLTKIYTFATNVSGYYDGASTPVWCVGSGVRIGDDIYLFGGQTATGGTTHIATYKYTISTNTAVRKTNVPYNFNYGICTVVGSDIYLFCDSYYYYYKYSTISDTFVQLGMTTGVGIQSGSSVVSDGTDIYLFGTMSTGYIPTYWFKYTVATNTFSEILSGNIYRSYNRCNNIIIDGYLYLVGCYTSEIGTAYPPTKSTGYPWSKTLKINLSTLTITVLPDSPIEFNGELVTNVDSKIYCFKPLTSGATMQVFSLTSKVYDNDKMIIITRSDDTTGTYKTQMYQPPEKVSSKYFGRLCTGFNDVFLYENNDINNAIPTYYGNGTAWVKFKN